MAPASPPAAACRAVSPTLFLAFTSAPAASSASIVSTLSAPKCRGVEPNSVFAFPYPLRFLFVTRPAVLSQVQGIVYRAISTFLIRRAGLRVGAGARTGAVTLIQ